uniref:RNase H domain-containing protein n=1 Tax=Heterorhabditis bacteriophora TaxID=37862 RepID=A0A1I7WA74_HETBA
MDILLHIYLYILQSLWAADYAWDTPLSNSHSTAWREILKDIDKWEKRLPRYINRSDASVNIIIFADASQNAIATCAYLKTDNDCHLIMAKSKLSPIKGISTIPKMEMNAITIATRLALAVFKNLCTAAHIKDIIILSDSEIALKWLNAPEDRKGLGVLVTNRRIEIRNIVMEIMAKGPTIQFGYVPTHLNPADCATRGLVAKEFSSHFWWNGPQYITKHLCRFWVEIDRIIGAFLIL